MKERLEIYQKERTRIIGEMLDNSDGLGIYPTTKCFNALDKLFTDLVRGACIEFSAEFAYYKANPDTKMDVPSIVYEAAEKVYDLRNVIMNGSGFIIVSPTKQQTNERKRKNNDDDLS